MPFELKEHYAKESDLKTQALAYLQARPEIIWVARFNSGSHLIGKGKTKRFIRYAFPGCSDLLGQFKSGHFLAVELKVGYRKTSTEQQAFIDLVNAGNGLGIVAWSIRDIADAVDLFVADAPVMEYDPQAVQLRRALGL